MQTHPNKEKKMMGQQQQTAVAGSALRRILLALLVAALMAAMMVAQASPAFAATNKNASSVGRIAQEQNDLGKKAGVPGAGGSLISGATPVSDIAHLKG
jgi:hypothetical protein